MVQDIVIKAEDLCKAYFINQAEPKRERYVALRDVLKTAVQNSAARGLRMLQGHSHMESIEKQFWALKDVSFEIARGDVVGIIGRNGAGKSTLLKVLSRITEPTHGRVKIKGRLASLLEVGTGFHPELSGRENIFLNGAILGMTRREILSKFDEIVDFAEVEQFLETPVKRYSSGMYVRLAFAVAAHLNAEILVIDEVLAVGDGEFQKKCLGKMEEVASGGRTVLFVSHNIGAVNALCSKCMLLADGKVKAFGGVQEAISMYLTSGFDAPHEVEYTSTGRFAGDSNVNLRMARIAARDGMSQGVLQVAEGGWIEILYEILNEQPKPRLNVHIYTDDGTEAFGSYENTSIQQGKGVYKARMWIPPHFLNAMRYSVSVYFTSVRPTHVHLALRDVLHFEVIDDINAPTRQGYDGVFAGSLRPMMQWRVEREQ